MLFQVLKTAVWCYVVSWLMSRVEMLIYKIKKKTL